MTHGGDLTTHAARANCQPHELLDFSANINPMGPPDWLREEIDAATSMVVHYPDPQLRALNQAARDVYDLPQERVVWGNGASQLIFRLMEVLPVKRVLLPVPCYIDYERALLQAGCAVTHMLPEDGFGVGLDRLMGEIPGHDLVVLGNPNNPNGSFVSETALLDVIQRFPQVWFVVDEAFIDFVADARGLIGEQLSNLIVLRSATKLYCIPGLRLGFAMGPAQVMETLQRRIPPWSVNTLAQRVGERALRDGDYARRSRDFVQPLREQLCADLNSFPALNVIPSHANFLLVELKSGGPDPQTLANQLLQHRIIIRTYHQTPGIDQRFFRVAVRTERENQRLVQALSQCLPGKAPLLRLPRRKPALMFQGTASNVGKSILTTALCRIMVQDGFHVAPFKAQNMSNNAYVTHDGGEMGRAQVLQAQAAKLDPDVRMNPVLLKPTGERGSQVIVNGQAQGHMDFRSYRQMRQKIAEAIHQSYDSLAGEYDVMLLEGAGSPAEVNLKAGDLVNMNMAAYADAQVVLVGNIDVGGVFASLVGTMGILTEAERARVFGYVLNRFRGDVSLLDDALTYMHRRTGKPVLGVVPGIRNLALPQEDSVDFVDGKLEDTQPLENRLDIAVVALPHISNLSDLDALRAEPDVRIRTVSHRDELGRPHMILLLGSKHVLNDCSFLKHSGLAVAITDLVAEGVEVVGLCGGLQMLGQTIRDPEGIEGHGHCEGLELLPIHTHFRPEKTLCATAATYLPTQQPLKGYEIHHGQTDWGKLQPLVQSKAGKVLGVRHPHKPVWGTYLHGMFDADGFRRLWLNEVRERFGLQQMVDQPRCWSLEPELDRLADVVRASIDVPAWYRYLGLR